MRHMFDLNEEVTIVNDIGRGYFNGVKGIIRDVCVEGANTIYGIEVTEGNDWVRLKDVEELVYFLAMEIQ